MTLAERAPTSKTTDRTDTLLLMTPGPTRVPERVLAAGGSPKIHHRTPAFSKALVSVIERLRPMYGTASADVLPIHTTGRGALEASIANLFSPGDELVACCNGKFGEMWAELAESYGLVVHRVCTDWSRSVRPDDVEQALRDHPRACGVTVAHSDTSTGVQNDVASVLALTRSRGILGMVDCISSLGGAPFAFDEWGADVVVTASQKCLMASPGLAFVAVSDRAWKAYESARLTRNYWDFRAVRDNLARAQPETPGTAPVHIFLQLAESLAMIHEEGLPAVYARHEAAARTARERALAMGFGMLFPDLDRWSPTLTALRTPAGVSPKYLREGLVRHGILVGEGLGPYAGQCIRIGHMGDIRVSDVDRTCDAIEALVAEAR
jgi:aspartate aminotransferase-like enzyme